MKVSYYTLDREFLGDYSILYEVKAFKVRFPKCKAKVSEETGFAIALPSARTGFAVLSECDRNEALTYLHNISAVVMLPPANVHYESDLEVVSAYNGRSDVFPAKGVLQETAEYVDKPNLEGIKDMHGELIAYFGGLFGDTREEPIELQLMHESAKLIPVSRDFREYGIQIKSLLSWVSLHGGKIPAAPESSAEYLFFPSTIEDWYVCLNLLQRGFINIADGVTIQRICAQGRMAVPFDTFVKNIGVINHEYDYMPPVLRTTEETALVESDGFKLRKNLTTAGITLMCLFLVFFALAKLGILQTAVSKLAEKVPLPPKLKSFLVGLKYSDNLFHRYNKNATVYYDGKSRPAEMWVRLMHDVDFLYIGSAKYKVTDYDIIKMPTFSVEGLGKMVVVSVKSGQSTTHIYAEDWTGAYYTFMTKPRWLEVADE